MGDARNDEGTQATRVHRGMAVLLLLSASATACGSATSGASQARAGATSTLAPATASPPKVTAPASGSPGAAAGSLAATPSGGAAATAAPSSAGATPAAGGPEARRSPATAAPSTAPAPPVAAGWMLTTVYTAVESFHAGAPQAVTGCPPGADECTNGSVALGSYPGDFLDAVRSQGTGRITGGQYAGRYLSWDADSGYAVDAAVLDASEKPMRAFVSAGADPSIPLGTAFQVLECGVDRVSGHPADPGVCARIRAASWVVRAAPRQAGERHSLELYIGEEDGPGFTAGPMPVHTVSAGTTLTGP